MPQRIAAGITLYLLVVFATVLIPIPEWGVSSAIVNDVYPQRGGGLWEQEPERAIAGGAVYFLLIGLLELYWGLRGESQENNDNGKDSETVIR